MIKAGFSMIMLIKLLEGVFLVNLVLGVELI